MTDRVTDRILYSEVRVVPPAQSHLATRLATADETKDWRQPPPDIDEIPQNGFIPTELFGTHQIVRKEGGFDECVHVTDQAYEELIKLATHERTKDKWNKELMHSYLKYTWIRLMEQHRVLNVSAAQASNCKEILESAGVSEMFAAFNTGLVSRNGEDIFAVLVQSTPGKCEESGPPYTLYQSGLTLQHSGIYVTIDDRTTIPFIEYLQELLKKVNKNDPGDCKDTPLVYHNKSLKNALMLALNKSLLKASFFRPRDENLLLDWTADIECNAAHIITERLDRFLEVGVIDEHEAVIHDQEEVGGNKEGFQPLEYKGHKKLVKMYTDKAFYFRREKFGVNACALKLNQWIDDAKQRVQGTFTLAVPQVYYQLIDDKYTGRLQLLIPLFCGTNKAKLALSLDYIPSNIEDKRGKYWANTVLKIQWAYSNARLLAAPQTTWILQDIEKN